MKGWDVSIVPQGTERSPVLVIDNFVPDAGAWIADAQTHDYQPIGPYYPGVRSPVEAQRIAPLITALAPHARDMFGAATLSLIEAFYSLVTAPPAALAPIQRLPHFDGLETERLALLHFLSRDETSGTAFYRHRSTGFETVDAARYPHYDRALRADVERHGMPSPGYIAGDTPIFEQVAVHRARFNRAILYRSNTLHCALIPPGTTLTPDPATGRLTVNTFLSG